MAYHCPLTFSEIISGGYASSGTFTSRVFSLGSYNGPTTVSWNAAIPLNTGLTISVRSGNTLIPDANWSAFVPVSNNQILNPSGTFIQYQLELTSSSSTATPQLSDIKFDCTEINSPTPPVVTQHPADITTCANGPAVTFTSSASGSPAPTVQWR